MVGKLHELAHRVFSQVFERKLLTMGIDEGELETIGGARMSVRRKRGKEPDSAYIPTLVRPYDDCWPTLVVEAGVSESVSGLQRDARWWLKNSEGDTNTVLLIFVSRPEMQLYFEIWELVEMPRRYITRGCDGETEGVPMCTQSVEIIGTEITGDEDDEDDEDDDEDDEDDDEDDENYDEDDEDDDEDDEDGEDDEDDESKGDEDDDEHESEEAEGGEEDKSEAGGEDEEDESEEGDEDDDEDEDGENDEGDKDNEGEEGNDDEEDESEEGDKDDEEEENGEDGKGDEEKKQKNKESKRDITIDFRKTFLRTPQKNDGESNIRFTGDDLKAIARRLWGNTRKRGPRSQTVSYLS